MGDLEKSIFYKGTSLSLISKTLFLFTFLFPLTAQAQQVYGGGEDDMRDIFVAGGYGALFGATMGTAILPFLSGSPMNNIRVVAGGASIGFMMGSAYGLYNVSKAQTNSYFNYTPENNDDNYYYSMPPVIPGQGYVAPKKEEKNIVKKKELPKAGALIVGEGSDIGFAIPAFWIGEKQFGFVLASLRF
ncbi:MAG: hypothetical protein K2X69_08665 [Silvanigrellaceae bacterium]|nr:hypothetical protein [Silvanigrellaceae bacterium]